jgi:hypothetical protein
MDSLNRRRAKQSGSAEVRIKFAMLSSQCKTAREWETSTIRGTLVLDFIQSSQNLLQSTRTNNYLLIAFLLFAIELAVIILLV